MTETERLHILQHSLGLNQYGEGNQYRNRYVCGPGNYSYDHCLLLVEQGLMVRKWSGNELTGGDDLFMVTAKGIDYVALNSPPAPKLTRSQQRYRDWLRSDCGYSFREWLGVTK